MTIDLYFTPGSAPCSAVLITAKSIGLELNIKSIDLERGEHMTPEFLKVTRNRKDILHKKKKLFKNF